MFKKPVKVFCSNEKELANLLIWLRANSGLSYMNEQCWEVSAIIPGILGDSTELLGFWVSIPYALAQPRMKKISEQEAFADILHQERP